MWYMNENQGQLMPNLSRPPGPRPFKKKGTQMEDNSKEINDIVSKTANVIGCGKKFGGWTDNSTNEAFLRKVTIKIPAKANTKPKDKKKGSLVGRIIRGIFSAGEPTKKGDELVKIGPDSSRPENERQYTYTKKAESVVHEEELKKYFPVNEGTWGGVAGSMVGRGIAGNLARAGGTRHASRSVRAMVTGVGDQAGWYIGNRVSNLFGNREKKRQREQEREQARLQAQQQ